MNALDLVKRALAEWQKNRGSQTLYLACQWFDGWYVQWAFEGFTARAEKSIKIYSSARLAALESSIFTTDVNAASVRPGDLIYWEWATAWHVGTVIGRDGNRTLVSHTGSKGDVLFHLGNHARVSHADSLPFKVYGVSHTNGRNKARTGLTGYNINQPAPAVVVKGTGVRTSRTGTNARTAPVLVDSNIVAKSSLKPKVDGTFNGYIRGQRVIQNGVASDLWFRGAYSGLYFWAGNFTSQSTAGLKNLGTYKAPKPAAKPKPAKKRLVVTAGWYYFPSALRAVTAPRGHRGPTLPGGSFEVTSRKLGAVQVRVDRLGLVWLHPKAAAFIR